MDKYRATRLVLEGDASLFGRVTMVRSPTARLEDVLSVHCAEYVTRVSTCTLSEKEERAIGFPMRNQEQVTRSFASTGGTIAAMHDVLIGVDDIRDDDDDATNASVPLINSKKPFRLKVACQIAGGTHHAFHDSGEGFCVFNDIACAATVCLGTYGHLPHFSQSKTPILVIDLDVHQGNGTAKIFENNVRESGGTNRAISLLKVLGPSQIPPTVARTRLTSSLQPTVQSRHFLDARRG
jgi:acetoin utilization deacetylase AcuC-like enzyme